MIDFINEAEKIKDELINIRRDIHMHPEIGYEEKRTSKKIKEYIFNEGIKFYEVAKTGVCGIIKGEKGEGKVIGVRADIDALPLIDKKEVYYASRNYGIMHACGHDVHTAILLGVSKIINKYKSEFAGAVKLIFEPAEETEGGAKLMIEEGILDNPNVDAFIGLHVSEAVDCGKIQIREGMCNAASNPFKITLKGKAAHGANPNLSVDPIVISSQVILALQTIISREMPPHNPTVITIGSVNGGSASNIIPEEVVIKGTIRTISNKDREFIKKRVSEIVSGICRSFRANVNIEISEGYPCLYNDKEMTNRLKSISENILGQENVCQKEEVSLGVESFSYFANERPSVYYYLGVRNDSKNINKPAHGNYFDVDEDAITLGVALQCSFIYDYLTSY